MRQKTTLLISLMLLLGTVALQAQSTTSSTNSKTTFLLAALAMLVLFILGLKFVVSGYGKDASINGHSVKVLKKGQNLSLAGAPTSEVVDAKVSTFAIQPISFHGISPIPKVEVEIGNQVNAGDSLFFDKKRPTIKYVAPVSGEVIAINRGAKRAIHEVVIKAAPEMSFRQFELKDASKMDRSDLVAYMQDSGVWPYLRQRPFNVVAEEDKVPVNIFVSTFNTAPLAADLNKIVEGNEAAFQKGIDVLGYLTEGKVHLGVDVANTSNSKAFTSAQNCEINYFKGPHPTGNVGIQIHHIAPVSAGNPAWTISVQGVIVIGRLFLQGKYDTAQLVALTGDELNANKYVATYQGANVGDLVKTVGKKDDDIRFISGDVLTGQQKVESGFLNFYDNQLTAIEEGHYLETFGWLVPSKRLPTVNKTFVSGFVPAKNVHADTNQHGEKRAFVMTGEYEKYLPMDVYPQYLFKAIITNDYEGMETLGLYELVEEDVALCEFACTSKQPLQKILREGLNMMHEQV